MHFELVILIVGCLLLASTIISKLSEKFGIPSLILFLIIGILAGSEGVGKIDFNNAEIAQYIGIIALVYILFSGGLDTNWKSIRPIIWKGISLATVGILVTAILVGFFSVLILKMSLLQGFLLGSIIASTDAAAVFAVLRSTKVKIREELKSLAEFESGINDPMAVFLTLTLIQILKSPELPLIQYIFSFFMEMTIGLLSGFVFGWIILRLVHMIKLDNEDLYPVLIFSSVLLVYGLTSIIHGSGFLAVYILGIVLGNRLVTNNNIIKKFHRGITGLMEIAMFIVLGLLVFPSQLLTVIIPGLFISIFLTFIARPIGVFISLIQSKYTTEEKLIVSWLGIRGAVPIVLAIFPLLAGIKDAQIIFNIVFFVVFLSALFKGTSIPFVISFLGYAFTRKKPEDYQRNLQK